MRKSRASRDLQASFPTGPKSVNPFPRVLEDYACRYPELAQELRQMLPAMRALADLGLSAIRETSAAPRPDAGDAVSGCLGDFRILREIGRRGMGVVYEAEQISLGRRVALKLLPFAALLDRRQFQRFHNEAQAAAALDHPNIVSILLVGCERGVHYYAMQYIEGQTLPHVIEQLRERSAVPMLLEPEQSPLSLREMVATQSPGEGLLGQDVGCEAERSPSDAPNETLGLRPSLPAAGPTRPGSEPSPLIPRPSRLAADTQPLAAVSTQGSTRTSEFFRSVAELGIQAPEALEHAHQMGVVHRGTKPVTNRLEGGPRMVELGGCNGRSRRGLRFVPSRRRLKVMGEVHGPAAVKMLPFSLLSGTLMAEGWRIIGPARAS